MARKLIVCCDGTGNEINDNQSNVLKFYRVLKADAGQLAYYHPGIGTISDSGAWSAFQNRARSLFGLATGYGLDDNVLRAYQFLIANFRRGDEIYLFGYSRGAYTVRVLAGFISLVGLLRPHQSHLAGYALTAYKRVKKLASNREAWRFQEVLDARHVSIRFMGCWDTVGSVIVPRPDRFYIPSLEELPRVDENHSVQVFRHAMSIDERRRMFRLRRWAEPQLFKSSPFMSDERAKAQDIQQVWFAGVHADVGGGFAEAQSGAAKFPLGWMVDEARSHGLRFRETMVRRLVQGRNPKNSTRQYSAPDPAAPLHESMNPVWQIAEYLPRRLSRHGDPARRRPTGWYLPRGERRHIPEGAEVHPSVMARMRATGYHPENLPTQSQGPDERPNV